VLLHQGALALWQSQHCPTNALLFALAQHVLLRSIARVTNRSHVARGHYRRAPGQAIELGALRG